MTKSKIQSSLSIKVDDVRKDACEKEKFELKLQKSRIANKEKR